MNRTRIPYYLAAVVALVTLVLYLPALRNGFVNWDDDVYVTSRIQIRSLDPEFFCWAFTSLSNGFWHPVTWISFAIDYSVWGLNPAGYHLTAIILHAINTFLVVLLVVKLLAVVRVPQNLPTAGETQRETPIFPDGRHSLIIAAVTGTLFGIHPLHVESVAWIAERKDLLCALFFLLSVMVYLVYAEGKRLDEGREAPWYGNYLDRRYLLSLLLFILALSSKTMAVTLPVVLLILDWFPLRRIRDIKDIRIILLEKIPFIACSTIISIVSIAAQKWAGALEFMNSVKLSMRVLVAFGSLVTYLWKMAIPYDLIPLYRYPKDVYLLAPKYFLAIILVGILTGVSIYLIKRQPLWLSLWSYYVITLIPVLGIVQVGIFPMADRFTYLPSLGPFLVVGIAAAWIWKKATVYGRAGKHVSVILGIVIALALSYGMVKQSAIWRNSLVLWNYVIAKEPNSHPVAYHNRGLAFREAGQLKKAVEDINTAIEREDSEIANLYNSRGVTYSEMGKRQNALQDFNRAIKLDPAFADAYTNRGTFYQESGKIDQAIADYDKAISLDQSQYTAYHNRGNIYKEFGRIDLAIEDLTKSVSVNPFFAQAYINRGLAFEQVGRPDLALEDYTSAIKADPRLANAYNNRGLLLEKAGRLDEALNDLDRAITLNPNSIEAYTNRGLVYEDLGRFDKAIEDHTRAILIDPKDALSYSNRAIAFEKMGRFADARKDHQKACDLGHRASCEALRVIRSGS